MKLNCVIRDYRPEDKQDILVILDYYSKFSHAVYSHELYSQIKNQVNTTSGFRLFLVAEYQDEIIGFCFLEEKQDHDLNTALLNYFLLPEYCRFGVGSTLLNFIMEYAKLKNIQNLQIKLSSRNQKGMGFHIKNGFKEATRKESAGEKLGKQFDIITLELNIPSQCKNLNVQYTKNK